MACNVPAPSLSANSATITSVGFDPSVPCACTPLVNPGQITLKLGKAGTKFVQIVKLGGTTPRIIGYPFKPQWLKVRVTTGGIEFTGFAPDTTPIQGTIELANECTPSLVLLYAGAAEAACSIQDNIIQNIDNSAGFVTTTVAIPTGATVLFPDLPSGVRAQAYGDKLSISGSLSNSISRAPGLSRKDPLNVDAVVGDNYYLPYSIKMSSACGEFTIKGSIITPPPCTDITLTGSSGDQTFQVGVEGSYCLTFTGGNVTAKQLPALPAGLRFVLTPGLLCIKGTPQADACAVDVTAGTCTTADVTIGNSCSQLRVNISIQVQAKEFSRPKFCAGLVSIEEVDRTIATPVIPVGSRRWKITADYFPVGSKLLFSLQGIASADGGEKFLDNSQEIDITASRTVGTVEFVVSGLGCKAVWLEAYHNTCAVMSHRAKLTNVFNINDDCVGGRDPNGGGAAGGSDGFGASDGSGSGEGSFGEGGTPGSGGDY